MSVKKNASVLYVSSGHLRTLVTAAFRKHGVPDQDAGLVADILIEANLRGHDSHGVLRVPPWIKGISAKAIKAVCNPKVVRNKGATAMILGDSGLGPVVAKKATALVLRKAKEFGIGLVSVRKASHIGILQYYSQWLAEKGVIGVAATNTEPGVAPFGSRQQILGTNPITISVPSAHKPYLVDMSTSVAARGKIVHALEQGDKIPEGWAVDEDGYPTTNPEKALKGALLPTGGPKGSGLAIMIDLLTGALAGASVGTRVKGTMNTEQEITKGDLFIAIDPGSVGSNERFVRCVENLASEIHESQPVPGVEKVLMPGEFERTNKERNLKNGINISQKLLDEIHTLAE